MLLKSSGNLRKIFPDGTIWSLDFRSYLLIVFFFLWFLTVMDLPSLLLPCVGKALKLNSDPPRSYSFYNIAYGNCELHSRIRKFFWKLSFSDYTEVTGELCSLSHREMPILISFRNLFWCGRYLLVSQKYVKTFVLQGGIYIPQSLTRHTNLFSWITRCSVTSTY